MPVHDRPVAVVTGGAGGIGSSISKALADAGISVSPIATYDTDYLFVKAERLQDAIAALRSAGHVVD